MFNKIPHIVLKEFTFCGKKYTEGDVFLHDPMNPLYKKFTLLGAIRFPNMDEVAFISSCSDLILLGKKYNRGDIVEGLDSVLAQKLILAKKICCLIGEEPEKKEPVIALIKKEVVAQKLVNVAKLAKDFKYKPKDLITILNSAFELQLVNHMNNIPADKIEEVVAFLEENKE